MTDIRVIAENRPANSRLAVVFCCDKNYLPYAALAIHTLVRNNPERDYDVCITSLEALDMPPALEGADIRLCQIDVGDAFDNVPPPRKLSMTAYLRLVLAEALAAEYDRILYLDCDIFVVGEALGEVFRLDLGGRPVGACIDSAKWKHPRRSTKDQAAIGISGKFFNSGMLLIDTGLFVSQQIRANAIAIIGTGRAELKQLDQPLLNAALQGNWAELHPAWNWQWAIVRPLFEPFIDVQVVHFISQVKPWSDPEGQIPVRYRMKAERFFSKHYPHLNKKIGAPTARLHKGNIVLRLLKHITRSFTFVNGFNRHGGDIMKVRFPR